MYKKTCFSLPLFLFLILMSDVIVAQPTWTLDPFGKEKKPEKYEEKVLGSEKTADKKFTTLRRLIQNNTTHYNYYFNANNKLNAVIERGKMAQKDDYSSLLQFYPYSLENTATQKVELDSVIYKSTAGILLHDLRSDWVDNLYLLIGKAYFLRNELDSAALTFQFINYNLFPRKKSEDDSRIVGANESATNSVISIANKENRNIVQKFLTKPPSRNDALIWQIRTLTDKEEYGDAAGLINILHNDPNLPVRLHNDLETVTAYWFFHQQRYDSAAIHLEGALSAAESKQDKARWEYLLGQLFEMNRDFEKASEYYAKASKHTVDPVMEIHAQLNDAKMFRQNGNQKELQNSIARLLKMAKKDKYQAYRDIIYYSTGQLSLQRPDTVSGITFYNKSLFYNENNPEYRAKSFLQLADISYRQRNYINAFANYDSLMKDTSGLGAQGVQVIERRDALARVVAQLNIIEREDSLQRIAAMAPAERDVFIKKLLKKYRKAQGLKDDEKFEGTSVITFNNGKSGPADLFSSTTTNPSKGDWYFYNPALKSRGFSEFKSKWGKRLNVDNWRRRSASDVLINRNGGGIDPLAPSDSSVSVPLALQAELSIDGLSADIPLTTQMIDSSMGRISTALLELGKLFQFQLQDHEQAIGTYEEYLQRFPNEPADTAYLGLYYSYLKLGNTAKANYYKDLLARKYPNSNATAALLKPASLQPGKNNPAVEKRYEAIYDLFLEGKMAEALQAKKTEDSLYSNTYWTPQLLYIEAIGFVKEKKDSNAIAVLNDIIRLYPASPLTLKSQTLISVLQRRSSIESYLTNLQVTRVEEQQVLISNNKPAVIIKQEEKPVVKTIEPVRIPATPILKDTVVRVLPTMTNGVFIIDKEKPHYVMMILDKVDGVYVNEAKNAFQRYNRERFYSQPITIIKDQFSADKALLIFSSFDDADAAVVYYDKIKKAAPAEVSWLQPSKYSFIIISDSNLQLLKSNKDYNAYKTLLNSQFNNRF